MAKFTDYTEKTEPVDTDLALIYDTQAKVNKKFTFGNLWKWIAKKIVSEGISQLDTTNKTIPGAINELNSKRKRECVFANSVRFPLDIYQSAILMGTVNSSDANLFLITRTYTNAITIKVITGTSNHGITGEFDKTTSLTTLKFIGNNSAVILY